MSGKGRRPYIMAQLSAIALMPVKNQKSPALMPVKNHKNPASHLLGIRPKGTRTERARRRFAVQNYRAAAFLIRKFSAAILHSSGTKAAGDKKNFAFVHAEVSRGRYRLEASKPILSLFCNSAPSECHAQKLLPRA